MAADLSHAIGLAPEQAIAYFNSKGYAISFDWQEVWADAHARAFTVAGVTKLDVLQDVRTALQSALEKGETLRDFQDRLQPTLEQKGWWGKGRIVDKNTGEITGKYLNPRRLETIYRTNLQSAYMAGRYQEQLANAEDRPYWEYVAIMDNRVRPAHAAMNGRIYRYDDPFWRRFYPPNGWRCRCRVRTRSAANMRSLGLSSASSEGRLGELDQIIDRQGNTRPVPVLRDSLGNIEFIADAGFGFNPGRAALIEDGQRIMARALSAPPQLAALAVGEALSHGKVLQATVSAMRTMVDKVVQSKQASGHLLHVGAISPPVLNTLERRGILPASGVLSIRDKDVLHALRDSKAQPLPLSFWQSLPQQLLAPRAILLYQSKARPTLLYVFDAPGGQGKLVVVLDYQLSVRDVVSGKRIGELGNIVRTGTLFDSDKQLATLASYERIWGVL